MILHCCCDLVPIAILMHQRTIKKNLQKKKSDLPTLFLEAGATRNKLLITDGLIMNITKCIHVRSWCHVLILLLGGAATKLENPVDPPPPHENGGKLLMLGNHLLIKTEYPKFHSRLESSLVAFLDLCAIQTCPVG